MKKVLITGGCGFLGQYLVKELAGEYEITVIDLVENPLDERVKVLSGRDITNYDSIKDDFKDIDIVIHLAGLVSFSLRDKEKLFKVNVAGTKKVLEAACNRGVKQLIHISSVAALGYKDDEEDLVNEEFEFEWKTAKKKKKYYMLTKHLADLEIKKSNKLNTVILYPGLMLGPGDKANSVKLIKAIKEGKIPFNMPGGTNITDVRDIARGIFKVMDKGIKEGEYLLSGHNLTFKEINNVIADEVGIKAPRIKMPKIFNSILFNLLLLTESFKRIELTADNLDSSFKFRYFDNSKAFRELGWEPLISFKKTIKDTVKWMEENGYFEK